MKSYAVGGKIVEPPRLISSISSLPSTFVWTNTGTNMIANVAYDLFTSANSAAETWAGDYELMIWFVYLPRLSLRLGRIKKNKVTDWVQK